MPRGAVKIKDYQYPPRVSVERQELTDKILWVLHLDGPFEDEGGGAGRLIRTALLRRGVEESALHKLGSILKEMATEKQWGGYVERKGNATRTYELRLAVGVAPDEVPFPANPFPADEPATAEDDDGGDVEAIPDIDVVVVEPRPDEQRGQHSLYLLALELTGRAHELAGLLAQQPMTSGTAGEGLEWVKKILEDNATLTEENRRLDMQLEGERALNRRLMGLEPGGGSAVAPEEVVAVST